MSHATRIGEPVEQSFAAAVTRALNETSTGPNGGYLLAPEFAGFVWDKAREVDGPLSRCFFLTTRSQQFDLPGFNESSRVTGSRWGGVRAHWEGGDYNDMSPYASLPSAAKIQFIPQRVTVYSEPISNDILDDSELVGPFLSYAASREIRFAVVHAMLHGTGHRRPLGVIKAPSTITVTRAGAGDIAVSDVNTMWSKLHGPCRRNAVWLTSEDTLLKLDATATTAGWPSNIYLPQGVGGNPYPLLKGRPVLPCEQCSALGAPGDLILGDWIQYGLCARSVDGAPEFGVELASYVESRSSSHVHFSTDSTVFRWKLRVDGKPLWAKPMTIADNSQTVGPFCILSA